MGETIEMVAAEHPAVWMGRNAVLADVYALSRSMRHTRCLCARAARHLPGEVEAAGRCRSEHHARRRRS